MKTTIDIADNLFREAKQVARKDGVTIKSLVDEGLEDVLRRRMKKVRVGVKPVVFQGDGLDPAWVGAGWEAIRDEIHGLGRASHDRR